MSRNSFHPVFDSRKRRVPGVYLRGTRYYGQLWVTNEAGKKTARKFALMLNGAPVSGVADAREAFEILKHSRRSAALPPGRRDKAPEFQAYAVTYAASSFSRTKKSGTVQREAQGLDKWKVHFAGVRLDAITLPAVRAYCEARLAGTFCRANGKPFAPCSIRSVNLDLSALRQVLKAAVAEGLITAGPKIDNLPAPPPARKRLLSPVELSALVTAIHTACPRNAALVASYVRFLAYTGAREQEALALRWTDVDIEGGRVVIGSDGDSKNRSARVVDLSPAAADLLREMKRGHRGSSVFLFPSPRRAPGTDAKADTLRRSMRKAREAAGMEWFAFHHLRHYFISQAVMSGIDFLTIAAWVGHQDGGILIGKVYGHLRDDHRKAMAAKLKLE